jgi:hypothetical protein
MVGSLDDGRILPMESRPLSAYYQLDLINRGRVGVPREVEPLSSPYHFIYLICISVFTPDGCYDCW